MINNKSDTVLRFYLLTTTLKNKIRQGSIYWNVTAKRRESIAEHVYDACMLAIAIDSEYDLNIDIKKVVEMLAIHELEEIIIGDITPFDNVSNEEKLQIGKKAVLDILNGMKKEQEYIDLTDEFNLRQTKEAKFAYLCDKLDFDLQMKLYADQGYIKLDPNSKGPIFKNAKVQNILKNGAKSASDVFYNYDVEKYINYPEFKNLLDYAYSNNLNDLLNNYLKNI